MKHACQKLKAAFEQNEAVCDRVNQLFHLLANKGRFRIVCLLCFGEFCVNDIAEVVSEGRLPNVSQHLKMLTLAGVIERHRQGQNIFYRLKDERVRNIIGFIRSQFLEGNTESRTAADAGWNCGFFPVQTGTPARRANRTNLIKQPSLHNKILEKTNHPKNSSSRLGGAAGRSGTGHQR